MYIPLYICNCKTICMWLFEHLEHVVRTPRTCCSNTTNMLFKHPEHVVIFVEQPRARRRLHGAVVVARRSPSAVPQAATTASRKIWSDIYIYIYIKNKNDN